MDFGIGQFQKNLIILSAKTIYLTEPQAVNMIHDSRRQMAPDGVIG
jgi:hypothetical protein